MKKIILFLTIMALVAVSCAPPTLIVNSGPSNSPSPTPGPTTIPAPDGLTGPVKAIFYRGGTVTFWDGDNFVDWKSGGAVSVPGYGVAVEQILYHLGNDGSVLGSTILPVKPIGLALGSSSAPSMSRRSLDANDDIWTFEAMTAQQAADLGYPPAPHTRIWKNDAEYPWDGAWLGNREFDSVVTTASGDVVWKDVNGKVTDLTTARNTILWYYDNGPLFWQASASEDGFTVSTENGNFSVTGAAPYFNTSYLTQWWRVGDTYYNTSGQTWSEAGGYNKHGTGLYDFTWQPYPASLNFLGLSNAVPPELLYVGQWQGLSYLIECDSGWLIALDTATGNWVQQFKLYNGVTNDNSQGAALVQSMQPSQVDSHVYLHRAGTLWDLDLSNLTVNAFSVDQVMWVSSWQE